MSLAFARQIAPRDAVQFRIDDRRQALQHGRISLAPGLEHAGQFNRRGFGSHDSIILPFRDRRRAILRQFHVGMCAACAGIMDNAPANPQTVPLSATVIDPQASFNAFSLNLERKR
jgi:hypothetical protein